VKPDEPIEVALGCDRWRDNYLERPHDEEALLYFPAIDITQAQFGQDEEWYFARIDTYEQPEASTPLDGVFGFEFDLNEDARGDYLLLVENPAAIGSEWSVTGVRVWHDENDDVGSLTAVLADETNTGDGYEVLIFDQGIGDDPDLAWARLSPEEPFVVQFAFKPALIEDADIFIWWGWAWEVSELLQPELFDFVDTYEEEDIFRLDNTCAWTFGALPRILPNTCPIFQPTPTPTLFVGGRDDEVCHPVTCYDPQGAPYECGCQ
jgi:hypothetical protein